MSIEIVERPTCPTCGGNKHVRTQSFTGTNGFANTGNPSIGPCITCHGDGTVPRTLATFADAAALHRAMAAGIRRGQWVIWGEYVPDGDETLSSLGDAAVECYVMIAAVAAREALGVSDDQG